MDELQHCNEAKIDGSVATLDKCSKKLHQSTRTPKRALEKKNGKAKEGIEMNSKIGSL